MEIIPREELTFECRITGREIENAIIDEMPSDGHLEEERLDEIFKPLIDSVEHRTELAVIHNLDEEQGRIRDQMEENEREKIINERLAELSEMCILIVNGKDSITYNYRERLELRDADEIVLEYAHYESNQSLYDACENDIMQHDTYESFWNDYLPTIELELKEPYDQLFDASKEKVFKYIKERQFTSKELENFLNILKKYNLPAFIHYLDGIIEFSKLYSVPRCQITIKKGKRKHSICDRPAKRRRLCSYHYRRDNE